MNIEKSNKNLEITMKPDLLKHEMSYLYDKPLNTINI